MKIGDKVYCIKSYIDQNNYNVHLKNKSYIIKDIDDILPDAQRIWINSEPDTAPFGYLGYIVSGKLYANFHYFDEHFLTEKECRKLKIQKLCGHANITKKIPRKFFEIFPQKNFSIFFIMTSFEILYNY